MYPFLKLDRTMRVLKSKKIQLLLSIYCSYGSVCQYEREDPSVWGFMSGSNRSAKRYLVKLLQTKQPTSFVKKAAKDLASYSVRPSWTFASEVKCQFLSPFGKIYYKTSSRFILTFHCLFLNQFISFLKKNGSYETVCNN